MNSKEQEYYPYLSEERLHSPACRKYPLKDLSAMGVAFQSMASVMQKHASSSGKSGLYYVNTKGKSMMQSADKSHFIAALAQENGAVGGGQAEIYEIALDPAMLCMAAALMNLEQKMNEIQKLQQEMMNFLQAKERAQVRGNINTLIDIVNNYKFNWDNEKYKSNKHILVQDIRRNAEQEIQLYRQQIQEAVEEKRRFESGRELNRQLEKLQGILQDYQLVLYQYAFSSYLEILLLGNFERAYLENMRARIDELALQYRELYTDCYNRMEQTMMAQGLAGIGKGAGEAIARIPVISKGPVDEALIAAGEKMGEKNCRKADKALQKLIGISQNSTAFFAQRISDLQLIYNEPVEIMFDEDNLYMIATA